ncbi:MAG TPA: GNAT family N-acetyltransferase, partial [Chloroflexia bacterium]|nr:GNAT family N-acetyltransferase [Chloroflexia bacterium]
YARWRDEVADFYARRDLPLRFQVSDAAPPELDTLLAAEGYQAEATTSVQTVPCATLLEATAGGTEYETEAFDALDPGWLDAFMAVEDIDRAKRPVYCGILGAIGPRPRFVQVLVDGCVAGVGMAVTERGWTGLFNIATAPAYRQRGVATAILRALAEWSRAQAAPDVYLQVMTSNAPGLHLYNRSGFRHLYHYHYRVR